MPPQKRKRPATPAAGATKPTAVKTEIKDEWEELPHNMGRNFAGSQVQAVIASPDEDSAPSLKKGRTTRNMVAKSKNPVDVSSNLGFKVTKNSSSPASKDEDITDSTVRAKEGSPNSEATPRKRVSRGRARVMVPRVPTPESSESKDVDEKVDNDPVAADLKEESPNKARSAKSKKKKIITSPDVVVAKSDDLLASVDKTAKRKPKKTRDNPYGLTPGYSPFPDWLAPTAEQCQEVTTLLASAHSLPSQPPQPPIPSTTVAGCGEVPAVLDAMIRTLLSANTCGRNSSSAFQGLLKAFGTQEAGSGKGSVNWKKVGEARLADVFEAIKSGGLAKVKSAKIKQILDMVFEQNTARRATKVAELESLRDSGAGKKQLKEKEMEIERLISDMLSLDHFHELESEDAMTQLTKFPNIGVKTASCILLFCMRRPSFAVDTHVWRMCKWLGWVPPNASRNETFSHLEVRCPDDLKYPLHQLLIVHGKRCGRCRANTVLTSRDFVDADCAVDHIVTRMGKRKGG